MAKAIHTMIRVFDLDRSREFYEKALALTVADHFDFDGFSLTYMRNDEADFEIELTVNKSQSEPYTHGDGYGHVAVCVEDAAAERERITGLGIEAGEIKEFFRDDALMARFFFMQDPDGYKIEVLERHGRYR